MLVGASYRHDEFRQHGFTEYFDPPSTFDSGQRGARSVQSVSSELVVPLIGSQTARPWAKALTVSLSGRYDEYSDFGSTANPKLGLHWEVFPGLALRGTVGTSFRAADVWLTVDQPDDVYVLSEPDPTSSTGTTQTLYVLNSTSTTLKPETSTTYSLGFDLQPVAVPGFSFSATYFNIDYRDKIELPSARLFSLLTTPENASFVTRSPQQAAVQALLDAASAAGRLIEFTDEPYSAATIGAIFNNRLQNVASARTSGIDAQASYSFPLGRGTAVVSGSGSYLLESSRKNSPSADRFDFVDRVYNPVDLRLRGGLSYAMGGMSASLNVNYVDGYSNALVTPTEPIASWTTCDLYLSYSPSGNSRSALWNGLKLSASVVNALDRNPPHVTYPTSGFSNFITIDPLNASVRGRSISVQATKEW